MKTLCVICILFFINSCGSNPKLIEKKTVFDNSLNREIALQLAADYMLSRGLANEYETEPEEIIEYDEYWAIRYRKQVLTTDAVSANSAANSTRIVIKIDKKDNKISEETIK